MRKKLIYIFTLLLTAFFSMAVLFACGETQKEVDNFHKTYELYVANAEESGIKPLSYEDWLQSIKGEKGEKGEKGKDGEDGRGISKAVINKSGELVITYTDGATVNLGKVKGEDGMNSDESSSLINVLSLGCKNDGSEDISDIINEKTKEGSLFFPAGTYKVSKPIYLKNPVYGEGYSRTAAVDNSRTWLISSINSTNDSMGVLNFSGTSKINVEKLNIMCAGKECGIRIDPCQQQTGTFINEVGIFDVRSYGLYVVGGGSRPIFAQNMSIFGNRNYPTPCIGIYLSGMHDNRFSNIEFMGVRIGMYLKGSFMYANNLHLWTGCLAQKDNGTWWAGTRGIVLDSNGSFFGTNIYPDTCYIAFEQKTSGCTFNIQNVMYWEDSSIGGSEAYDGRLFYAPEGSRGTLNIDGGIIGVSGNRMKYVYTPGQSIRNVILKSNAEIKPENIDTICLGDALCDYTLKYTAPTYCKVIDVLMAAETGACGGTLTLSDGAAYDIDFIKSSKEEKEEITITPLNKLCDNHELKTLTEGGVIKVFVKNNIGAMTARFTAKYMSQRFRFVDYGILRDRGGEDRYSEMLDNFEDISIESAILSSHHEEKTIYEGALYAKKFVMRLFMGLTEDSKSFDEVPCFVQQLNLTDANGKIQMLQLLKWTSENYKSYLVKVASSNGSGNFNEELKNLYIQQNGLYIVIMRNGSSLNVYVEKPDGTLVKVVSGFNTLISDTITKISIKSFEGVSEERKAIFKDIQFVSGIDDEMYFSKLR